MKRILYLDEVPEIAGGANSLLQILKALDTARFSRFLVSPDGPLLHAAKALGVQTQAYTISDRYESIKLGTWEIALNPYRLWLRFQDALRLLPIIRANRIDLIQTNNLDSHLIGWFLHKVFGYPVIWYIHIMTWPRSFYMPPWVNRIVFVSEAARRESLGCAPFDDRASVIPNGLDVASFQFVPGAYDDVRIEFGWPRVPIIATVGRLTPQKRHQHVVRAAHKIKQSGRDVRWLIVGSEIENRNASVAHEPYLMSLIKELGLEKEVLLTGQRRDIARLVSACDIFVFPAVCDSNPRAVLEAMSLAKPIVAADSGGLPEMLDDGRAGLLFNADDVGALSGAITSLLESQTLRSNLGERARSRALSTYSIESQVQEFEMLYEALV